MCFGVYNLPAPVGFSYTIINNNVIQSEAKNLDYVMWVLSGSFASLWMTDWKVTAFFLNAVAFFKNAVMFFKKTVIFFLVYDVQEISRISYTVIYCGSATCLPSVWNAGCFWKFPVYTCARINIKVGCFVDRIRSLKICCTASFENQRFTWTTAKYLQKSV